MASLLLILTGGLLLVIGIVLLRVWPAFRGRVDNTTALAARMYKWNTYVSPHIQKYIESKVLVASCASFTSGKTGVEFSMSTWSMHPTVMTNVDFIAIADPSGNAGAAKVLGFIEASLLRSMLGGLPEGPSILGHRVWTYVWPSHLDIAEVAQQLMTVEKFRTQHGLETAHEREDE